MRTTTTASEGGAASGGRRGRVIAALFVGVLAISFAAIFFKKASPTHPLVKAGVRLVLAAILLSPLVLRAYRAGTLRGRSLRFAAWAGVFYAVHFGAWVWSLGLTSVASSVTLVTATPLLLAIVALFTGRDRPSGRLWVSILMAVGGVTIIASSSSGGGKLAGDALALLGAAAMAGYLLLARRLGSTFDAVAYTGVACAVGGLILIGVSLLLGLSPLPVSGESLLFLVLAALIPQLVGHSLLTWSLRYTSPTIVGMATVGEPVFSTLLGWLWLSEMVGGMELAGCAVTASAVLLALYDPTARRGRRARGEGVSSGDA